MGNTPGKEAAAPVAVAPPAPPKSGRSFSFSRSTNKELSALMHSVSQGGSVILPKAVTILIQPEEAPAATTAAGNDTVEETPKVSIRTFVDLKSSQPLYRSISKFCQIEPSSQDENSPPGEAGNVWRTVIKDANTGRVLFLITQSSKDQRLIYQVPPPPPSTKTESFPEEVSSNSATAVLEDEDEEDGGSGFFLALPSLSSQAETASDVASQASGSTRQSQLQQSPRFVGQVDMECSGYKEYAFFRQVIPPKNSNNRNKALKKRLYQAVKVPGSDCGMVISDMEGQMLGKVSSHAVKSSNGKQQVPKIVVSAGGDVPAILALTATLVGEF